MLMVMMVFLIIIASSILLLKRNKETFYLFFMCLSLFAMLLGTFIYIAKKGGISTELQSFFFISDGIKYKFQYMLIQLDHLGFLIAVGRSLFPMFLLLLALHYSVHPFVKRQKWLTYTVMMVPLFTLVIYYPPVFRMLTEKNAWIQTVIMQASLIWMILFVVLAIVLLIIEARMIQLKIIRRNFLLIITFILSLVTLYLLYFVQDPAHVYRFYGTYPSLTGRIFYMKSVMSIQLYAAIVFLNTIAAIVGFASMYRYTQQTFTSMRHGEIIKYQTEAVHTSTSTFVHGIKNQLLAMEVIHKRVEALRLEEDVSAELTQYMKQLANENKSMLQRMDNLRQTIQTDHVHLELCSFPFIVETAVKEMQAQIPKKRIRWQLSLKENQKVLADERHLLEALQNILANAYEAIIEREQDEAALYMGEIRIATYSTKLYHVVEMTDNGLGMTEKEQSRISEPYYSRKNSTNNWGMGLYYVQKIIAEHFGLFRYESTKNIGSSFYIYLPKYKR